MAKKTLKRMKRKDNKMEDIAMTPMIDVVFQLLIYFVFTFEIPDALSQLQVYRPAAPPASNTPPQPPKVRILVMNDVFVVNDVPVNNKSLEDWLFTLADVDPTQPVVIQVSRQSRHDRLMLLLDLCKKAKLESLSVFSVD
jgi:biopolymer transport protein ExbD